MTTGFRRLSIGVLTSLTITIVSTISLEAIDACSAAMTDFLNVVDRESNGVWVYDRGAALGTTVADEKFHNALLNAFVTDFAGWYPVDSTKRVVCGTLEHWLLFRGPGAERDLHPYLIPSPSFAPILDDLPPYATTEDNKRHVYGEITPPDWFASFYQAPGSNPTFGDNACGADTPVCRARTWVGTQACVYGPWVVERIHNFVVEIHPAQFMWGMENNTLKIFALSDQSQRFAESKAYRRTEGTPRLTMWDRPVAPTILIATDISATQARSLSVLNRDPGSSTTADQTSTVVTWGLSGGGTNVTHTRDVQIAPGPACASADGSLRGLIAVTGASLTADVLKELDITGEWLHHTIASTAPDTEPVNGHPNNEEESAPSPRIELHGVEWAQDGPMEHRTVPLDRTKAAWGFSSGDTSVNWKIIPQQRLKVAVAPPDARASVAWTIEACDVEKSTDTTCSPFPLGSGLNQVYVEISHGQSVSVTAPAGVKVTNNPSPFAMTVFVRYPRGHELGDDWVTPSIRVSMTATLAGPRPSVFKHVLRDVAPDFAAAVQQYDMKSYKDAVPEKVVQWALGWLRDQGYTVSRAQLERDWDVSAISNDEFLGTLDQSARKRHARTLRLSLLTFLEDNTLDAEELTDVFELLQRYGDATTNQ